VGSHLADLSILFMLSWTGFSTPIAAQRIFHIQRSRAANCLNKQPQAHLKEFIEPFLRTQIFCL
jgi:hypothetical protein